MSLPDYTLKDDQIPVVTECVIDTGDRDVLKENITRNLEALGATLVAHYYVDGDIQDLALRFGYLDYLG